MKDLKITLACAGGVSTSILCKKIIEEGNKRGFNTSCSAYGASSLTNDLVDGSAVILLGPQIQYMKNTVVKRFPDYPVRVINMRDYGTMNAKGILDSLQKEFKWEAA